MKFMNINNRLLLQLSLISMILMVSACSSGRYQQKHDSTPTRLPNKAELTDATPRAEPHSRGGNKNYKVFGKPYEVLASAKGFKQTGIASWYGNKFHGHLTSNGEIYDMYAMSAAHKNLPLPTYLKVTNTANDISVIVRVNDRGPFHQSRIIDLSYSAAYKLDMLKTGTAQVSITAITDFDKRTGKPIIPTLSTVLPKDKTMTTQGDAAKATASTSPSASQPENSMGITTPYIQVFATSKKELAINTAKKLEVQYKQKTSYPEQQGIYRIQIGPINDLATLNALLLTLKQNGYPNAYPRATSE